MSTRGPLIVVVPEGFSDGEAPEGGVRFDPKSGFENSFSMGWVAARGLPCLTRRFAKPYKFTGFGGIESCALKAMSKTTGKP